MKVNLLLYAVTDRSWLKEGESLAHAVEKALKGGVTMVQLREKECGTEELIKLAREVKAVCGRYKVPLLINDNIEAAKEAGFGTKRPEPPGGQSHIGGSGHYWRDR